MVKNKKDRYYILESYLEDLQEFVITLPAVMTAISVTSFANTIYQSYLSKVGRRCRGMSGAMKSLCAAQVHAEALNEKLRALQASLSKCKNDKCRQKAQEQIQKTQEKLKNYESMIDLYKEKVKIEKEKEKEQIRSAGV